MGEKENILKPVVFKIFDLIEKGFDLFYETLQKLCPGFVENYLAFHDYMIYIIYGFLLFLGISLAYRLRKKIFLIVSLVAIVMIIAHYFL